MATVLVRFIPLEDTSSLVFELNNALSISKVIDEDGRQVPSSRVQQDMTVRLSLPQTLKKGKVAALTFVYDGKLTGDEESPVFGIKFAAIHPERVVPAVSGALVSGERLLHGPLQLRSESHGSRRVSRGRQRHRDQRRRARRTGGVSLQIRPVRRFRAASRWCAASAEVVTSGGITTYFYLRDSAPMAQAYGEEIAKAMTFFTGIYGCLPRLSLTVVETEAARANGYSAPGLLFLSPRRNRQAGEL